MSEYLKRKIDKYLFDWKANPDRKPLIIKGARQVGKTKSIETFAEQNYESIVEINFAEDPVYKQIVENGYSAEAVIKIRRDLQRFFAWRSLQGNLEYQRRL